MNDRLFTGCPGLVYDKSIFPVVCMILTMTAGTGVIMWLGELITERGVGNGMSVLIFTQIAATFPNGLWSLKVARPGWSPLTKFALIQDENFSAWPELGVESRQVQQRRSEDDGDDARLIDFDRDVGGGAAEHPTSHHPLGVLDWDPPL